MGKLFENRYGYFAENGREYVITSLKTPRPWVNVISSGEYGLVVSNLNGGFSWFIHSNLNRLTRWQQDLVQDNWGKYLYLRDAHNGSVWSPTYQPVQQSLEKFECRHGIGYTTFRSCYQDIESYLRVFVPFGDNLEIWTLTLKNSSTVTRQIGIFTYLEWCLGVAPDTHREFHKTFIETEFDQPLQVLLASKRLWEVPSAKGHWNTTWPYTAFLACNNDLSGYEGSKEKFLGSALSLQRPAAVQKGQLSNTTGKWEDAIGSIATVVEIPPGTEKTVHFFLGLVQNRTELSPLLQKYRSEDAVEKAFREMRNTWATLLNKTTVETPDLALNLLVNHWLKYQAISGRLWGRAAYYQQSGAYGFRDQLQDSQIFLYLDPERTRQQIHLHARHQFRDGRVLHWWHPLTEEGLDSGFSDDLLWLPFLLINYLKETAHWEILQEKVPYYQDKEPVTILEHCLAAFEKALQRRSPRGLPLILAGDWNDGLSAVGLKGKGESVWLAHFLHYLLTQFTPILQRVGQEEKARNFQREAQNLREVINQVGWDGQWYWRASKENGELIGSRKNSFGRIFLNAQSWAIISGSVESPQRAELIMKQVRELLDSDFGPQLFSPAYQQPDPEIGYLSRYAPGVRENGGIYTHAATWAIWAATKIGDFSIAYQWFRKICPVYNGLNPERYGAEPYVTPGNIDGVDSPYHGRGGWTWYTGSAAWLFKIILDAILGIEPEFEGLRIRPGAPKEWSEYRVNRYFRGSYFQIQFRRQNEHWQGKIQLYMNGKKLPDNLIPAQPPGKHVDIEVRVL